MTRLQNHIKRNVQHVISRSQKPVLEGIAQSELNIFRTSHTQMVSLNCAFLVTLNYSVIKMTDIAKAVYSIEIV